jgi:uncharacterized peroxidase-related enzyme
MTATIQTFAVPTRDSVSETNQAIFDKLKGSVGFVPNLYATLAHSETALRDYLTFQSRPSSLSLKEREVINLVVSQVNVCNYCLAAHTILGQKAGFTEQQTIKIRRGDLLGDDTLDVLAKFVRSVVTNLGRVDNADRVAIFTAGYTEGKIVDIIMSIGDKIITNYLHKFTDVPVDFPIAPAI